MYPPLPTIDARQTDEPMSSFGARALAFLLQTRITATLDDETLEQAEHASVYVVASPDICQAALEQINAVRLLIATTLRFRKAEATLAAVAAAAPQPQPKPGGGQRAKLIPITPRRPSPSAAVNPF